ncbi:MAG TPA: NAD(P)/FAD-dependent oxidoreductase [Sphingomonadaceae bacterium]|nr:NAD(P)/FAD-dependent oxidoreductase [Sphingomonadaceae bacterium]
MSDADIIAIGSGHNGLVAAAYCAVAGKKVLVLERNAWFGGGVVTRELTRPGFRHDQHSMSHIFIQGNPLLLNDELGLKSRYGLSYLYPETPMMSVFEDGATLPLHRDSERSAAEIARFSPRDAEAFRRLSQQAQAWLPMIMASLYTPPMPLGASTMLMDQSPEGRELWRIMQMSSHDVLCDLFEDDRVRMHFARVAGENLVSPDEKATGIGVYVFLGFLERFGFGVPVGGSGSLTDALVACIRDYGGEVIANADVREVTTEGGRATGVILADGTRHTARDAVIGAIHPHLLSKIVPDAPAPVTKAAEATQISEAACITVHAALSEPLRFRTSEPVNAVMIELMPDRYETLRRAFDDLRYGEFVRTPLVGLGSLSMFDPSRVPEGCGTLHAWDYVPYQRPDGAAWDETKRDYANKMIARMADFIENIPGAILDFHVDSPVDMERTSPSFLRGDLHGIATTTYQSGAHRPTPELGQYRVPGIDRLFLVGPFQHPGGGVFGAGRATAQVLLEDLGLDIDDARVPS